MASTTCFVLPKGDAVLTMTAKRLGFTETGPHRSETGWQITDPAGYVEAVRAVDGGMDRLTELIGGEGVAVLLMLAGDPSAILTYDRDAQWPLAWRAIAHGKEQLAVAAALGGLDITADAVAAAEQVDARVAWSLVDGGQNAWMSVVRGPVQAWEWAHAGFTPADAKVWDAQVSPTVAAGWRDAAISVTVAGAVNAKAQQPVRVEVALALRNAGVPWGDIGALCRQMHVDDDPSGWLAEGMSPARACRISGGGLSPTRWKREWQPHGFAPEDTCWFISADIGVADARGWRDAGFQPVEAHAWVAAGWDPSEADVASAWRDAKFDVHDAVRWRDLLGTGDRTWTLDDAVMWRDAGADLTSTAQMLSKGLTIEDCRAWALVGGRSPWQSWKVWAAKGFDAADAAAWTNAKFDVDAAAQWRDAGVTAPEVAAAWRAELVPADVAAAWQAEGLTPREGGDRIASADR